MAGVRRTRIVWNSANEVLRITLIHNRLSMGEIMFIGVHMFVHRFGMRWMDNWYDRVRDVCIDVLLGW